MMNYNARALQSVKQKPILDVSFNQSRAVVDNFTIQIPLRIKIKKTHKKSKSALMNSSEKPEET